MNQREYNKLFVTKNKEEGSPSILLGYKHDEKEITLFKHEETYFHVPLYSEPIKLVNSDLIYNGAIGGPFPAASDRIFKSKENYGNVTPHGQSSISVSDGTWFCSWLYSDPITKKVQWLDRFYAPGKFNFNSANNELTLPPVYEKNRVAFYDVPSEFVLEPGVLYKYFHLGETSFQNLLTTYSGLTGDRLVLSLSNWISAGNIDASHHKRDVIIKTSGSIDELFVDNKNVSKTRIFPTTLSFENSQNINAFVEYDDLYTNDGAMDDEFTWAFWANSSKWKESASCQLVGNFSTNGCGLGVFLENLNTTPLTIIPETTYGHTLFLNEGGEGYLDKALQDSSTTVSPACVGIDFNNNVIICNDSSLGIIYKMDHTGEIIANTKNFVQEETLFSFSKPNEIPKQIICGPNNSFYVITDQARYLFDDSLILKQTATINFNNSVAAFSYNSSTQQFNLELVDNVYDVKFIEQVKWSLDFSTGNLHKNGELFLAFDDVATNFAIDSSNRLWILHGETQLSVVDVSSDKPKIVNTLTVGTTILRNKPVRNKQISFINKFSRATNSYTQLCVIYYSDERILYYYNTNGTLNNVVYINGLFNPYIINNYKQQYEKYTFNCKGDFTGYEHKRVFQNLSPYNGKSKLMLKANFLDLSKTYRSTRTISKAIAIDNWQDGSWQHIGIVYKNKTFSIYVNGTFVDKLVVPGNFKLNYDAQPLFYLGSPTGNKIGFNIEIQYTSSIFNGKLGDVKIYNYGLPPEAFEFYIKSSVISEDMVWYHPTPKIQFVEEIERMYKHKLPGAKSQFFNLKIINSSIKDSYTRTIIENEIREIIKEAKPTHTDLLKVVWIDE